MSSLRGDSNRGRGKGLERMMAAGVGVSAAS